jgi:uncharacterized membrane protein
MPRRNNEIKRIETFSDAVFAFAITLLIVSLEVPKNFEELMINMRGFFAFGISFTLLVFIWNEQHKFFRNYGLDDVWILTFNMILLFIVLFYVYPLKFLFTLIFSNEIYGEGKSPLKIKDTQLPALMEIYAIGYVVIYSLFYCMYLRALKMADHLGLNELERFDCQTDKYKQLIMISVGLLSFVLALTLPSELMWIAGITFAVIGPALTIFYFRRGRKRKIKLKKLAIQE